MGLRIFLSAEIGIAHVFAEYQRGSPDRVSFKFSGMSKRLIGLAKGLVETRE